MYYIRSLVAYAHVRPPAVVETDVPAYGVAGLRHVAEGAAAVHRLLLDDAVDAFGHGVVRGVVVLGHANGYAVPAEFPDVGVAAVLHAAVGVVYEAVEPVAAAHGGGLAYGLAEGVERLRGAQRW